MSVTVLSTRAIRRPTRRPTRSALLLIGGAILSALAGPAPALAQSSSVVVLGVRSVEGDDDVAHDLTTALREAAKSVEGWSVSGTAVSMAQMALAHGCEEVDAACLADIAKGLSGDLIVYGTLRRNSARDDYDFAFSVNLFDAKSGTIVRNVDDTIPRRETTKGALSTRAQRLIGRVAGVSSQAVTLGSIAIEANVAAADVLINQQPVGSLDNGALQFEGLQAGMYRVELRTHGYAPFVTTVNVDEGKQTVVRAELVPGTAERDPTLDWEDSTEEPASGHGLRWLGWTLVGVGAASAVGAIVSWSQIVRIDNDDRLQRWSNAVAMENQEQRQKPPAMRSTIYDDICEAADDGLTFGRFPSGKLAEVQDLCAAATTWEVAQYIFVGGAALFGGTGIVLLLTAGPKGRDHASTERAVPPRFSLTPHFGAERAGVSATLRF
jgi:hypothetical protein